MIYSYPILSGHDWYFARISCLGMGNFLFPWARCLVASRLKGWKMIAPQWYQYDVYALWQRNRCQISIFQNRCYFGMLKEPKGAMRGFGRLFRLALLPHVEEPAWPGLQVPETSGSKIVVFRGIEDYFEKLLPHYEYVRSELLARVQKSHLGCTDIDFNNSITVNVRLGDTASYNQRTTIEWYVGAVQELRDTLGAKWPVYIVSDGTDHELRALLRLERTHRLKVANLAGLLTLSRAHVLVATAGSSYSMWASFLGRMPVLWPPNATQRRQFLYPGDSEAEPEWNPGDRLSAGFLEAVARHGARGSRLVESSPVRWFSST